MFVPKRNKRFHHVNQGGRKKLLSGVRDRLERVSGEEDTAFEKLRNIEITKLSNINYKTASMSSTDKPIKRQSRNSNRICKPSRKYKEN